MGRKRIICGNWKMYKTIPEATEFIKSLAPLVEGSQVEIYLAVPFTAIQAASNQAKGSKIVIGAQNMNDASEGAFTGEIAGSMLKDAGAQFVILGHSERRVHFGESNELIRKKVEKALNVGLQPILCIGESLKQREEHLTEDVLEEQLEGALALLSKDQIKEVILAYEPVWAIGTGKTATPEIAEEAHRFCREWIAKKWGEETAQDLSILYGGSVKPDNIASLMQQPDLDGALVGGASLKPESFHQLILSL